MRTKKRKKKRTRMWRWRDDFVFWFFLRASVFPVGKMKNQNRGLPNEIFMADSSFDVILMRVVFESIASCLCVSNAKNISYVCRESEPLLRTT
jgi:hypothetical protein